MYAQKRRAYDSSVDDLIIFNCTVMMVDDPISVNSATFSVMANADFNSGRYQIESYQNISIVRLGIEDPILILNASIWNDQVFGPKYE